MIDNDRDTFLENLRTFIDHAGERTPDGYGRSARRTMRGEVTLMRAVLSALEAHAPVETLGASWLYYLDHYLVDAFDTVRRRGDVVSAYLEETGENVPDLIEIHGTTSAAMHRLMVVQSLVSLCGALVAEDKAGWVCPKLEATLNGQSHAVRGAWLGFVRVAYRQLAPRIKAERHRTNVGIYGATTLKTYACAGRVVYQFSRDETWFQYVADEDDMHGQRCGPNTTHVRYDTCISMIEELSIAA